MSCVSHIFTNKNGYKVCTSCGEAEKTHYWSKDRKNDAFSRNQPVPVPIKIHFNSKWYRLLNINSKYGKSKFIYVNDEVLCIVNQLPFSVNIRKELYSYIMNKKFTSFKEVWEAFYRIICIRDLPITTKEYISIINSKRNRKKSFKIFKPTHRNESVRKYYWYITKCIKKAQDIIGFSYKEGQDLYKIVFNYYILIRFKMLKSTNPILLIENLVYYTIRDKLKINQQVFNKTNFGLSSFCYITQLVKYLKEIKENNLDSPLSQKLVINTRN